MITGNGGMKPVIAPMAKHFGLTSLLSGPAPVILLMKTGMRPLSGDIFFTKVISRKEDHEFGKEKRLWQEINFQIPLKNNFFLQNRFRVEESFLIETSKAASYHAFRFRYRLAAMKKLSEKWSIQVSRGILEQLSHDKIGFNLNRVSLSGTYQFRSTVPIAGRSIIGQNHRCISQHIFSMVFQKKILVHLKKKSSA